MHEVLDILIFGGSLLHCGVLGGVPLCVHIHIAMQYSSEQHLSWGLVIFNWNWLRGIKVLKIVRPEKIIPEKFDLNQILNIQKNVQEKSARF